MPAPKSFKIDTSTPVMVTGATGYVAGELIKQLLEAGVTVHAAVRDPAKEVKVAHLKTMAGAEDRLKFFKADLLDQGSYADAMAGCSHIFHTASPFTTTIKDPQRDMVDPALKGTENVLASAAETPSVKRIVLTSSCVAIYGDTSDIANYPNGVMTEAQWNETSTLTHQTYSYSKTVAERRAWDMAADASYDLVVVNPGFVIGAGTMENPTSESFSLITQLIDGTMRMGAPDFDIGCVDVRDVALAHIRAAYTPEAQGRHITVSERKTFLAMAADIRAAYPDLKTPKSTLPKWLVKLIGPLINAVMTRRVVEGNVGHPWKFDNSKAKAELGMEFRPVAPAFVSMAEQIQQMQAKK